MSRPHPHTQTELAETLERWYATRSSKVQLRGGSDLADWEKDAVFMVLAMQLWPVDMEASTDPHYQTSNRMRMRIRHEGFRAAADAADHLVAFLATADFIRTQLERP